MPMSMITYPAVCRLKTEVFVVTAKARIAPMPISTSPIPVFIRFLRFLARSSGGGRVGGFGRVAQLAPEGGQRPGREPGAVHLGDAEPVADLRLGQVAVEAHDQDALLPLGQLIPVGVDGFHVDRV